jgi:hypothetical protein
MGGLEGPGNPRPEHGPKRMVVPRADMLAHGAGACLGEGILAKVLPFQEAMGP